jgi:hypothetical protein
MTTFSVLRTGATLSGVLLAIGLTGPASAQSKAEDLARCQGLYSQWSRYNGTFGYGHMAGPDIALEECRKGNATAGIADLKRALERANIPLPASETATAR